MHSLYRFCSLVILIFVLVIVSTAQVPTSNLKLHLKADAGTSTTSNGVALSSWVDQSGNGNDASQSSGGAQPTYVSSSINGLPAIRFNGSTSFLDLPTASTLGIQNSEFDVFVVAKSSNSGIQFLIGGTAGNYEVHLNGASGARFIPKSTLFVDKGATSLYTNGSAYIFNAAAGSENGVLRVNGYAGGDSAYDSRNAENSVITLGRRGNGTFYLNGDIAEVIIYNSVLSAVDRASVESYLAAKYSITLSVIPSANLRMHLRADAGTSTTTDGVAISSWTDKTMNNFSATQESGVSQPVYKTNIINGKPVVRFNGSSALNLPRPSTIGIKNSPYDIFIVARSVANGTVQFLLAGGSEQFEYHLDIASGSRFIPKTGSYVDKGVTTNFTNGAAHLFQMSASSTIGINRVNGLDSVSISADVRSSVDSNLALGFRPNEGYFLNGDIAEVIIYNTVLSHTDRIAVQQYLSERYNVGIYSLTIGSAGEGTGTVSKNPDQTSYAYGANVQLTASATLPNLFSAWSGDTVGTSNPRTIFMNGNKTITATFNSGYTVTSTSDENTGSGNSGTLRYVLNKINTDIPSVMKIIDMTGISGTITLTSALPPLNYSMSIIGPGMASLTINGDRLYRPFFIGQGTSPFSAASPAAPNVTMKYFTVANGLGKGGNGWSGAGGGAGMGGAIFLNAGTLNVDSVSFTGNVAKGGFSNVYIGAGGGGGFEGDAPSGGVGSSGLLGEAIGGGSPGNFVDDPGSGGFGGGGGSAANGSQSNGGSGGFGSGGGSGAFKAGGGYGNFGGANGGYWYGGGGGGGAHGGAIFNRNGTMIVKNSFFYNDSAIGGFGQAGNGQSYGGAIFNYSGMYYFSNNTFGSDGTGNSSTFSTDSHVYGGVIPVPTVVATAATSVTTTSAVINGTINPNGAETTYRFAYGSNASSLSDTTVSTTVGNGISTVSVDAQITGLTYGTFYFYRVIAVNEYGTSASSVQSFIYDTTISRTNLKVWLSADKGVDTTGGSISTWYDRSSNGLSATQTTGANKPILQDGVLNGKPVVRFNGTTSYMMMPNASEIGLTNSPYEMFIVTRTTSSALQFVISGAGENYELHLNGGNGVRYIPIGSVLLDNGADGAYDDGQGYLFTLRASTSYGIVMTNGEVGEYSFSNATSSGTGSMFLGQRAGDIYRLNGDIAEVIMYDTTLSKQERLAVSQYLSQKYNISLSSVSAPDIQSSLLTLSNVTDNSMKVTVTKGNGTHRMIIAKSGSSVDGTPLNAIYYTGNVVFGSGSQIGTGNYVVYSGQDSVVTVTGLSQLTQYHFSVVEYNGVGPDAEFLTSSPSVGSQMTLASVPMMTSPVISAEGTNSFTIKTTINPMGTAGAYRIAYGIDSTLFGDTTASVNIGSGSTADSVSSTVSELVYGGLYFAKVITSNAGGTVVSGTKTVLLDTSVVRSGLKFWVRADKGTSTIVNGANITRWLDVSGSGHYLNAPGTAPIFNNNHSEFNSKPAIQFNGSSTYLNTSTTTSNIGIQNADYEMFIVGHTASTNIMFLMSAAGVQYEIHLNGGNGIRYIPGTGHFLDHGADAAFVSNGVHLFSVRASSAGGAVRVDGVDGGTNGNSLRSSADVFLQFGRRFDNSYYLNGEIAEILIYNRLLTEDERSKIELSLGQKYSIESLPVELTSFTVTSRRLNAELQWKTAAEVKNYGFEIQRAMKQDTLVMMEWSTAGFVEGNGTTNAPKGYSFTDKNLQIGKYSYRLKQIDHDGKFEYSQAVEVTVGSVPKVFALEQNYPNPFNPSTTIGFTLQESGFTTLKIYDAIGREVTTLVNENLDAGIYYQKIFDASKLASGIYFARLTTLGKMQMKKLLLLK